MKLCFFTICVHKNTKSQFQKTIFVTLEQGEELTLDDEIRKVLEAAKTLPDIPELTYPTNPVVEVLPMPSVRDSNAQPAPTQTESGDTNPAYLPGDSFILFWDGEIIDRGSISNRIFNKTKDFGPSEYLYSALEKLTNEITTSPDGAASHIPNDMAPSLTAFSDSQSNDASIVASPPDLQRLSKLPQPRKMSPPRRVHVITFSSVFLRSECTNTGREPSAPWFFV